MFLPVLFLATLGLVVPILAAPALKQRQNCADVMVIFARGTTEPAPIGAIVGPPFEAALTSALGSKTLSFQGVDYPANIPGFLEGGDPQGSSTMATDLTNAANSCPNAAIVAAGYSQGGQLVHNSAKQISADVASRISSVVIFGDPDNGEAIDQVSSNKVKVICHTGDDICLHGDLVLPPHLTYGQNAAEAAQFVASNL